jgi:hypothetical protein
MSAQDHFDALPLRILCDAFSHVVFQVRRKARHERCTCPVSLTYPSLAGPQLTRGDTIRVECLLLGQCLAFPLGRFALLHRVLGGPESPTSLLIHFRPRRNTINGHEEYLLRLNLGEEMVDICEYREDHLLFRYPEVRIIL